MWEKNKGTVTCDVETAQCEDGTIKCEKIKIKESLNVTKEQSHMMLELYNVKMEPLTVRKKKKEQLNVTIVQSHVMLVLDHVRMELSNVKKKGTTKCDKSTVKCYVDTAECDNGIIKHEKKKKIKKKELPNVTKEQWHMMLVPHSARMEPSNVREKREPLNARKVLSNVILVLSNVTME